VARWRWDEAKEDEMAEAMLEHMTRDECVELLRSSSIGRIAVVDDGVPVVFPVNYRLIEDGNKVFLAIRTRRGNIIDRSGESVGFQLDAIDPAHTAGWSVLVRGLLHHLGDAPGAQDLLDPHPWIEDRDEWLLMSPVTITGRRVRAKDTEWAFHTRAYL
jgi:nitroimidazol reductase NimA-like FMN-containing flavoprotein (pyridoxamine 5'-phosphate oxidase superfamily)